MLGCLGAAWFHIDKRLSTAGMPALMSARYRQLRIRDGDG